VNTNLKKHDQNEILTHLQETNNMTGSLYYHKTRLKYYQSIYVIILFHIRSVTQTARGGVAQWVESSS